MSDENRFRHADAKGIYRASPASSTVIEAGDLVVFNSGSPEPIDQVQFDTSLPVTKGNVADDFGGVAMVPSADGETDPIEIATRGVYEFPLGSAATAEVFDYVTAADDNAQTLKKDRVETTTTASEAFGWCFAQYTKSTAAIVVRLLTHEARHSLL